MRRPTALTIPVVIVNSWPNGLPMAMADWPGRRAPLLPRVIGTRDSAGASILITAMSESLSTPTTEASYSSPLWKVIRWVSPVPTRWNICDYVALAVPHEPGPFAGVGHDSHDGRNDLYVKVGQQGLLRGVLEIRIERRKAGGLDCR